MRDPIVNEVRKIRKDLEEEYNNDAGNLLTYIYAEQKKHQDRLTSKQSRKIKQQRIA